MSEEPSRRQERGGEIGVESVFPSIERQFPDWFVGGWPNSGIGDHHIDPAQCLEGARDQIVRFCFDPEIGPYCHTSDFGCKPFGCGSRSPVVNGDPGSFAGESPDNCLSNTSGAPGYDYTLARQSCFHAKECSAASGPRRSVAVENVPLNANKGLIELENVGGIQPALEPECRVAPQYLSRTPKCGSRQTEYRRYPEDRQQPQHRNEFGRYAGQLEEGA
jgi:hypothetical protein